MSFKKPGFTCIPNDIARSSRVSPFGKTLYLFLSSFHPAYPSYDAIQAGTGMSRATIKKYIDELVGLGLIEYDRGNSKKKANLYNVHNKISPTSSNLEPVDHNQFKSCTSSSSNLELQPVQILNSNNTNEIILIKKEGQKSFRPEPGGPSLNEIVRGLTSQKSFVKLFE